MQITAALKDALAGRLHLLGEALTAAGHSHHGLSLEERTLLTNDGQGSLTELEPAAQTFVAGYAPPAAPMRPDYGDDLPTTDALMSLAATAVQQIRAYRALTTPTEAQRKAYESLLGSVALHYLRSRFPSL